MSHGPAGCMLCGHPPSQMLHCTPSPPYSVLCIVLFPLYPPPPTATSYTPIGRFSSPLSPLLYHTLVLPPATDLYGSRLPFKSASHAVLCSALSPPWGGGRQQKLKAGWGREPRDWLLLQLEGWGRAAVGQELGILNMTPYGQPIEQTCFSWLDGLFHCICK